MSDEDIEIAKRLGRFKSGDSRSKTVGARVNGSEERELIDAAERDGKNVSDWIRAVLLREARRLKDDALFTEIVATRMLVVNLLRPLALGQKVTAETIAETMALVRKEKHKAAWEVMQQYAGTERKESQS